MREVNFFVTIEKDVGEVGRGKGEEGILAVDERELCFAPSSNAAAHSLT